MATGPADIVKYLRCNSSRCAAPGGNPGKPESAVPGRTEHKIGTAKTSKGARHLIPPQPRNVATYKHRRARRPGCDRRRHAPPEIARNLAQALEMGGPEPALAGERGRRHAEHAAPARIATDLTQESRGVLPIEPPRRQRPDIAGKTPLDRAQPGRAQEYDQGGVHAQP